MSQVQQALPMIEKGAVPFDGTASLTGPSMRKPAIASPTIAAISRATATPIAGSSHPARASSSSRSRSASWQPPNRAWCFPVQVRLGPHDFLYLAIRATGRLGDPRSNARAMRAAAITSSALRGSGAGGVRAHQ